MINYKEKIIYTHNNNTSQIRMFMCLHCYDQWIEIPQWNERHF